ncbi:hypothetical protein MRB53_017356 [Persea americana]|uniref:Uncharacterized protein n=1 Tax=Persea americana TaxID=3435 RepID=A0ACC2M4F5_PERAE|nr:hypothetical protein MRB53_017356 [Persea americana]
MVGSCSNVTTARSLGIRRLIAGKKKKMKQRVDRNHVQQKVSLNCFLPNLHQTVTMERELKSNLEKANNRAKLYYDHGHREEQFEIGDWVFLKIQPQKQKSVTQKALFKLGSQFYGPYKVLQHIGEVAYKLELPSTAHIHPVFHVSQLKRRVGNSSIVETQLPVIDQDGDIRVQPSRAIEYRQMKRGNRVRWEVLIQWDSLPPEESTWEDLSLMKLQFPSLVLEDKDKLKGGGNDEDRGRNLKNAYNRARCLRIKEAKLISQKEDNADCAGIMHESINGAIIGDNEGSNKDAVIGDNADEDMCCTSG